jgi:fatty-acid peroxygenase
MTGAAAAELFYDPDRFIRHGAMPHRILATLLGRRGVQTLDDDEHRHRKQLFMSLMSPARVARMAELSAQAWHQAAVQWQNARAITLYDEARRMLARTACRWAGVPLREDEVDTRTAQLSAMFDGAGSIGPRF